jgi:uncharacterized protein YkwD
MANILSVLVFLIVLVPGVHMQGDTLPYTTYIPIAFNREKTNPCDFTDNELEFFNLVIKHPEQKRVLACNQNLYKSSSYKTNDMALKNYYTHISPTGEHPNEIVKRFGCKIPYEDKGNFVEVLVIGTKDPTVAFNSLMNSQRHKNILLGLTSFFQEANQIGISMSEGHNNYFWVIHIVKCGA